MKTISLVAALGVLAVLTTTACQKKTEAPAEPAVPAAGTQVMVVGGMKNQVFTAASAQHIALTDGTTGTPITDKDGVVRGVSIARDNAGGIDMSCSCPGGCSEGDGTPGSTGCVAGIPTGGHDASCSGNCSAPNKSCMACSFSFPQPDPSDARAVWVKRTDLVASPNP